MKKKMLVIFCCFCFFLLKLSGNIVQAEKGEDEPTNLYARSAVLMDADSGRILFGKDERRKLPMASTTKIMTCILVLEQMQEDQKASVSDYAVCQPKVRLGVKKKEQFYVNDLLYSLMLESHNDSAVVLAEAIAGTVDAFADFMNEKAKKLGCQNTHFVTPNGLDGEDEDGIHETTAEDLARIMRYCIMESEEREKFLEITQTKDYSFSNVAGDRTFTCHNHNAFLSMMEGALSGKTGFTSEAGYCYVGALRRDGRTFIVSLLACGWPNNKDYKWKDTRRLMEYGLEHYHYQNVEKKVEKIPVRILEARDERQPFLHNSVLLAEATESRDFKILLKQGEEVEVKIVKEKKLHAPVRRGQKVGTVRYRLNGETIHSTDLIASESIQKRDLGWCFEILMKKICF